MRIGLDFDNTIACYDGVFHAAACARDLIPPDIGTTKNAVRDYLNGAGQKDTFTELQGWVYGARMDLVSPYPGVGAFLDRARALGHELCVISHKTRVPLRGPAYDMHEAARGFLTHNALVGEGRIPEDDVFFAETKEAKIALIGDRGCDVFVDDLPEILVFPGFPTKARGVLFDPNASYPTQQSCESWDDLTGLILGRA
ncbi:hypothetical protein [Roseobacter sp.]|uniref:hypothetical protein n=1 Tax=Roseobacter sp. TaxID=1907202 RepID=UPI0032993DC4